MVHRINEYEVSRCFGGRLPVFDAGPPAVFSGARADLSNEKHLIHVDNVGCFGGEAARVGELLDLVERRLNDKRLATHEREISETTLECLEVELKLAESVFRLTGKRYGWCIATCRGSCAAAGFPARASR